MKHYYVSTTGNDLWSGKIDTPNADRDDGPFKTITRARDAVREHIKKGLNCDVKIYLREGTYRITETLQLDERDSGTEEYKICYMNYPGEKPVITGSSSVTGWTRHEGNVYKARIHDLPDFNVMYEDGVRGRKARWPKESYNVSAGCAEGTPFEEFSFKEGDIPVIKSAEGLQVFLWPGGKDGHRSWFTQSIDVKDIDYENNSVKLSARTLHEMGSGSRYFIRKSKELLSDAGEFYFDKKEKLLYYVPRSIQNLEKTIEVPLIKTIFKFRGGSPGSPVKNIVLKGLTFCNTDTYDEFVHVHEESIYYTDGTIVLENTENLTVSACRIYNTGFHGIVMNNGAVKNSLTGNHLYEIGHTGIQVRGANGYKKYINKNNTISNNYIHDTGKEIGHGAGVQLFQSGENVISHNKIFNTSRYSISLKSWPYVDATVTDPFNKQKKKGHEGILLDGVEVTKENVECFNYNRNNVIKYNDVSKANLNSQDTGVIETWGAGVNNIIQNNWIHDSDISFSFGFGIYLDSPAPRNYIITKNLISNLQQTDADGKTLNAVCLKGYNHKFTNNIVADNNLYRGIVGPGEGGTVVEKNIFYNSSQMYYFFKWNPGSLAASDYNLVYDEEGKTGVNKELKNYVWKGDITDIKWETLDMERWREVTGHQFDEHTTIEDPNFMGPGNGDFRLHPESSAYELGFEDIDYASIGLAEDFPFRIDDELHCFYIRTDKRKNRSWVTLSRGEKAVIDVIARSVSGSILPPEDITVSYEPADKNTVHADSSGTVRALAPGETAVTVTVSRYEKSISKDLLVFVEGE